MPTWAAIMMKMGFVVVPSGTDPEGHLCQANNGGHLYTLDFFHFFSILEKHGKSPCFQTSERA
jgi:hypothetical protein